MLDISPILSTIPERPGVYLYHDSRDRIIYVGKSVNLRARVGSYFHGASSLTFAKRSMVAFIVRIEWIEAATETEALVLETNLIKRHRPKYNILMKDDKNLSYIVLVRGAFGEVGRTRIRRTGGEYYGPYISGSGVAAALETLRRIFRVRACRVVFGMEEGKSVIRSRAGRSIPCLDHYIGLCPAPCILTNPTMDEHRDNVERLRNFLRGDVRVTLERFEQTMHEHASRLEFEEAGKIKRQIDALTALGIRQIARDAVPGDHNVVVYEDRGERQYIGLTEVREGEIASVRNFTIETHLEETRDEILAEFLERYLSEYSNLNTSVKNFLVESLVTDESLERILTEGCVTMRIPRWDSERELLAFARRNLLAYVHRETMDSLTHRTLSRTTHESILRTLGASVPMKGAIVFECYDISHLGGTSTVASRSVIVNGKPALDRYRRYRVKTVKEGNIDDFASLREVIGRRCVEGIGHDNFPHMIIIDGGKGQLSSALSAAREAAIVHGYDPNRLPPFVSLAKREELVFTPENPEPVRFERGTSELALFQTVRDEAHRFAVSYNRSKRSSDMKRTILEELPWFGPITRKKLLSVVGSIDHLATTDHAVLRTILTKPQMETLESHGLLGKGSESDSKQNSL